MIYVFMGLIASGKSTLAERFAAERALPYYNTDRVRKELAGLAAGEKQAAAYSEGIYTQEFSERTYREMLERTAADLRSGSLGVVLDGSYHQRSERDRVRSLALAEGVSTVFILCRCGDAEVKRRLAERARDPQAVSDGRWEIYLVQKGAFQEPDRKVEQDLIVLETEQPVAELLAALAQQFERVTGTS